MQPSDTSSYASTYATTRYRRAQRNHYARQFVNSVLSGLVGGAAFAHALIGLLLHNVWTLPLTAMAAAWLWQYAKLGQKSDAADVRWRNLIDAVCRHDQAMIALRFVETCKRLGEPPHHGLQRMLDSAGDYLLHKHKPFTTYNIGG